MALQTKTIPFGNISYRPYGELTITETSVNNESNTSSLLITLVLKRPSNVISSATKTATCIIDGKEYTWSGTIGGSGDLTLISETQTIEHDEDGTKTISFSASIVLELTWSGILVGTISGDGNMTLTENETSTMKIVVNGEYKRATPYIGINYEWKKCQAYIGNNYEWKKGK